MNLRFQKQYTNDISVITDGLTHKEAIWLLERKVKLGLVPMASLVGYKDAYGHTYDKYWRYSRVGERDYLAGVQAAINNGTHIERYIDIADCHHNVEEDAA